MNRLQASSNTLVIYTLPSLVNLIALLLTLAFLVFILSVLAGIHLGEALLHPNPFAAYETLWPGQMATNIVPFARMATDDRVSCLSSSPSQFNFAISMESRDIFCTLGIQEGPFRLLSMSARDGEINELELFSDNLSQDDLLLYWGVPDKIRMTADRLQLELYWNRITFSATASVDIVDATVKSVKLTSKG